MYGGAEDRPYVTRPLLRQAFEKRRPQSQKKSCEAPGSKAGGRSRMVRMKGLEPPRLTALEPKSISSNRRYRKSSMNSSAFLLVLDYEPRTHSGHIWTHGRPMTTHEMFDGRLQIYRRPGGQFWQSAARVGGRRFRQSTKEEQLDRAKDVAENWYLELRGKRLNGEIIKEERTFKQAGPRDLRAQPEICGAAGTAP
jgi:hypothetical protein